MNPKIKKRLLKLVALTESTNEHEAVNAEARIRRLCVQHNIDIDVILSESEEVEMYWFRYDNPYVKTVLKNTLWRATGVNQTYKNPTKQRQIGIYLTEGQNAEAELWCSIMRDAFKKHLNDSTSAFIMANNLYGESEDGDDDSDPLTDEEIKAIARRMELAEGITPTRVNKAICYGND